MEYTAKVIEVLGKAIIERDITISTMKWRIEAAEKKIAELEAQLKTNSGDN